jgi:predicted nucleic acid-binding protein
MRIVVDASAIVQFIAREDDDRIAAVLGERHDLHVPAVCDVEVVGGLAKHVRNSLLSPEEAREALIDYVSMPLARHLHVGHVARTFELSSNFAAADASYVALAEALGAGLVTLDGPLGRAIRRHTSVEVIP